MEKRTKLTNLISLDEYIDQGSSESKVESIMRLRIINQKELNGKNKKILKDTLETY